MCKIVKFTILISIFFLILNSSFAFGYIVIGIFGRVEAGLGDCEGWNNSAPNSDYLYTTIAEGEPIKVTYWIDDDDDEVQTAKVEFYLLENKYWGAKEFKIHTVNSIGQGEHTTVIRNWRFAAGFKPGDYYVKVKATVITPTSEKGTTECEYAEVTIQNCLRLKMQFPRLTTLSVGMWRY